MEQNKDLPPKFSVSMCDLVDHYGILKAESYSPDSMRLNQTLNSKSPTVPQVQRLNTSHNTSNRINHISIQNNNSPILSSNDISLSNNIRDKPKLKIKEKFTSKVSLHFYIMYKDPYERYHLTTIRQLDSINTFPNDAIISEDSEYEPS